MNVPTASSTNWSDSKYFAFLQLKKNLKIRATLVKLDHQFLKSCLMIYYSIIRNSYLQHVKAYENQSHRLFST